MQKIIILSGGFDPIHSGHIMMFNEAKKNADLVAVALNSDAWLVKKKGINFLPFEERAFCIESIKSVDYVFGFADDEKGSAVNGIIEVVSHFDPAKYSFAFGNGGDRDPMTTPTAEQAYCMANGVDLMWGLGGKKTMSSSHILERFGLWYSRRMCENQYHVTEEEHY